MQTLWTFEILNEYVYKWLNKEKAYNFFNKLFSFWVSCTINPSSRMPVGCVYMSSDAYLACMAHALSTEGEEIMVGKTSFYEFGKFFIIFLHFEGTPSGWSQAWVSQLRCF